MRFHYNLLKNKTKVQSKNNLEFKIFYRFNNIKFIKTNDIINRLYTVYHYTRHSIITRKKSLLQFIKCFTAFWNPLQLLRKVTRLYTLSRNNIIIV